MTYRSGNAKLESLSGKQARVCDNCGVRHATMYRLSLAKSKDDAPANLEWVLCVVCNGNISRVYESRERDYRDGY
jgi:transcriptional regulator NrdR family protein